MQKPTKRELEERVNSLRQKLADGISAEDCIVKTIEECVDRADKLLTVAEWLAKEFQSGQ